MGLAAGGGRGRAGTSPGAEQRSGCGGRAPGGGWGSRSWRGWVGAPSLTLGPQALGPSSGVGPRRGGRCWEAEGCAAASPAVRASMCACACVSEAPRGGRRCCRRLPLTRVGSARPCGARAPRPPPPAPRRGNHSGPKSWPRGSAVGTRCPAPGSVGQMVGVLRLGHQHFKARVCLSFLLLGIWPKWARAQTIHLPLLTEEEREKG